MHATIRLFIGTAFAFYASQLHAEASPRGARGYFVSIDGLQPKLLESWVKHPDAVNGGFKALWSHGAVFPATTSHIISITAASHAGTATCSSPARHGITGNHFLRGGKRVSGFKEPFQSETMWEAARRQGKKVASFAYVGMDATSPARTADVGITYPDESRMGQPQIVTLPPGEPSAKEIHVNLNPETGLKLALTFHNRGQRAWLRYFSTDGKRHEVKLPVTSDGQKDEKFKNLLVHDGQRMRRIVIRTVPGERNTWLVSRASYNAAFPESFRKKLDDAGLVWPDVSIKGLELDLPPSEAVAVQGILDDFIATVASRTIPEENPDIVLFYQPLIDSTGHGFQNKLPDTSDLNGRDLVTAAFRAAFKRVDRNIASVLQTAADDDVIALMGDHGMTATRVNLNVAPVLPPEVSGDVEVYASDSMLYLYPKQGKHDAGAQRKAGESVREALKKISFEKRPVTGLVAIKDEYGPGTWPYGEALWAFRSAEGIWFINNPLQKETFLPPKVPGMHGHDPTIQSMLTAMIFRGRGVRSAIHRNVPASLVQAVPTFARLLELQPPRDCEGSPLL